MRSILSLRLRLLISFTLLPACSLPAAAVTQPPNVSLIPTDTQEPPSPTDTIGFTPTASLEPTAQAPIGIFTWAVIVDLDSEPVSRSQAEELVNQASLIMMELTGFAFQMVDFMEAASPDQVRDLAVDYIATHADNLPNGIIIFSFGDNDDARLYGGYGFAMPGPAGFRNAFNSPVVGNGQVYISIQHWSHRYAACGYGGSDVETPVRDTSFNGECRGVDGVACVQNLGYSMCSDAVDNLYASSLTYFASSTIIHELLHPFGFEGVYDHFSTQQCRDRMASGASTRPFSLEFSLFEAQYYNGTCPDIYDNFVNSYQP